MNPANVIHTYLFIHFVKSPFFALLLSMVVIIAMALILAPAGKAMGQMLAKYFNQDQVRSSRTERRA
jgi:hypothetical protein